MATTQRGAVLGCLDGTMTASVNIMNSICVILNPMPRRLKPKCLKLESPNPESPNGLPPRPLNPTPLPPLSFSRPSWVVRTESNVWRERRKKPDPSCVVCHGSGRVDCRYCCGKGRTNFSDLAMLPKGEWPKWCRSCHGSGLSLCSRCVGTGEYRYIMGFHFMKREDDETRGEQKEEDES